MGLIFLFPALSVMSASDMTVGYFPQIDGIDIFFPIPNPALNSIILDEFVYFPGGGYFDGQEGDFAGAGHYLALDRVFLSERVFEC